MLRALQIEVAADSAVADASQPHTTAASPPSPFSPDMEGRGTPLGGSSSAWKKHIWKMSEDERLHMLVRNALEQGGKVRWSAIGAQMDGRSGKQCRERWHNHLSPEVTKVRRPPSHHRKPPPRPLPRRLRVLRGAQVLGLPRFPGLLSAPTS